MEKDKDYRHQIKIIKKLRNFVTKNLRKDIDDCKDKNKALISLNAYLGFFSVFYAYLLGLSPYKTGGHDGETSRMDRRKN